MTTPAPLPPLPAAVNWDASIRAFTVNPDGTKKPVHPVDQQVQLLLTIEQGTIPALGPIGQRYRKRMVGCTSAQANGIAMDETKVALAALLKAGDVTILSVKVDANVVGRKLIHVNYRNNRLPATANTQSTTPLQIALTTG